MSDIVHVVIGSELNPPIEVVVNEQPDIVVDVNVTDSQEPPIASHEFTQVTPSYVWTINHNLGFKPNVTCFGSDDDEIEGDLFHVDENTLTISYLVLVSGYAILS